MGWGWGREEVFLGSGGGEGRGGGGGGGRQVGWVRVPWWGGWGEGGCRG